MTTEVPVTALRPDQIIQGAAAVLGLVAALYLGFKGRAKWEPHDQDVPRGSQRLGSLAAGVFIILVTYFFGTPQFAGPIGIIAVVSLVVAIVAYFSYQTLTTRYIYLFDKVVEGMSARINVLGGITLTPAAARKVREGETIQTLVYGCGGDLEKVWDRNSRAKSRLRYEASYMGLVVGGSTALACVGILASWAFTP